LIGKQKGRVTGKWQKADIRAEPQAHPAVAERITVIQIATAGSGTY
jgi:hypothetical protein